MANEDRLKLYKAIDKAGYDIGSYEDFDRRMNNPEDRQKFYNAVSEVYDIGSQEDFERRISPSKYNLTIGGKTKPVSEKEYLDFMGRHPSGSTKPAVQTPVEQSMSPIQKSTSPVQKSTSPVQQSMAAPLEDNIQWMFRAPGIRSTGKKEVASLGVPFKPDSEMTAAQRDEVHRLNNYAAKEAMKRQREEERRRQPLADTGNDEANQHIIRTQGEWEDDLQKSARNISGSVVIPAIDKAIADFDKKAHEVFEEGRKGSNAGEIPTGVAGGAGIFGAYKEANKAKDPEKVLKYLQQQMEDVYKDSGFVEKIGAEADKLGIDRGEYLEKVIKPQIAQDLATRFENTMIARELPKSGAEYVVNGLSNSIVGMIADTFLLTKGQRDYKNQAQAMTEQGSNPYYQPGTGANLARVGVTFAADAPFFGVSGSVGGMAAKRLVESQIKNLVAKGLSEGAARSIVGTALENSVGQRMKNYIMQHVVSSSITMGGFNAMSEGARQVRDEEFDPARLAGSTAEGALTGAAFGVTGGITQALAQPLSGFARVGAKVAGFGAEAETMYATEELARMAQGEEGFENPFDDSIESLMKLGVMKVSSPGGLKKGLGEILHPVKSNQKQPTGIEFTPEEEAYVRGDGKSLLDALGNMHPERSITEVNGKKKLTPEGERQRQQLAQAYDDFMNNTEIPANVKQKVAGALGGVYRPGLETGCTINQNEDGTTVVKTRDKDGNCIQELMFDNFDEADNWRREFQTQFERNDATNMWNNASEEAKKNIIRLVNDQITGSAVIDSKINRIKGMRQGRLQRELDKINQLVKEREGRGLTEEETRNYIQTVIRDGGDEVFKDLYNTIREQAYPSDELNTRRNYFEGQKMTPEEYHQAQVDVQRAEQRLIQFGDDFANEIGAAADYPDEKMAELASRMNSTDPGQRVSVRQLEAALDYFNKVSKLNGAMDEAVKDIEDRVQAASSNIRRNIHTATGTLMTAELEGKNYYVTAGDIQMTPDGRIDPTKAGDVAILRDVDTGEIRVVNPRMIRITSIEDPNRVISVNEQMLRDSLMKAADENFTYAEGTPQEPSENGDTYVGADGKRYMAVGTIDEQGQTVWQKVEVDEQGNPVGDFQPFDYEEYRLAKSNEIDEVNNSMEEQPLNQEETTVVTDKDNGSFQKDKSDDDGPEPPMSGSPVLKSQEKKEPLSRIPVDEKGRKLYEQAKSEDTLADLTEKYGEEKAQKMIAQMAENTARAFEELSKKDTSKMTDMADLEAHEDALAEAQAKMQYWQDLLPKQEPVTEEIKPIGNGEFEKKPSETDKTTDTVGNLNDLRSDTALPQTEDSSEGKDTNNSANNQEKTQGNAPQQLTAQEKIALKTVDNNYGRRYEFNNQDGTRSEIVIGSTKAVEQEPVVIDGKQVDLKKMTDEELLDAIRDYEERERGFHIEEYDERHRHEYNQEVDSYSEILENDNTSLDDTYGMYAEVSKKWNEGGFASVERTKLMAQIDALENRIDILETKRIEEDERLEDKRLKSEESEKEARAVEENAKARQYEQQKEEVRAHGYDLTTLRVRKLAEGESCHVERRYTENKSFSFTGGEHIETANDVAYIFRQLEDAAVENSFMVMVKDGVPTVIHLAIGSYAEVAAPLTHALAAAQKIKPEKIWFLHNHPSGNLRASRQDRDIQKKMENLFPGAAQPGIIINTKSGKYAEYRTDSNDIVSKRQTGVEKEVPVKVFSFDKQVFDKDWDPEEAFTVRSTSDIAAFVSSHRLGEHKKMSLLILDQAGHVTGNVFLPWTDISDVISNENINLMATYVNQMGGTQCVIYGDYKNFGSAKTNRIITELNTSLRLRRIYLRDALSMDNRSAYNEGMIAWDPQSPYDGSAADNTAPTPEMTPEERQYWKRWDDAMRKWKERNAIPENVTALSERPRYQQGESALDFAKRLAAYNRERALWQTAPRLEDYRQRRDDKDILEAARENERRYPHSQSAKMRRVAAELQQLRHAMSEQKDYDKSTVKAVTDFAQDFMRQGYGDNLSRGEMERMLSSVKNATGAKDIRRYVDNIMNILVDNQLRNLDQRVVKLSSVKELRQTAQGVEAQGKLELKGQRMIQAFREAREGRMDAQAIRDRLSDVADKMSRNDEEAPMWEQEYEGLSIALQYQENIEASRDEWATLDREYKDAVKNYRTSGRSYKEQQEYLESIEQAMTDNKIERIGMFGDIIGRLEGNISESMQGAKDFVEREKQRVSRIHQIANSDLAGKDMGAMRESVKGKPANFFLQPLATFEQMLKMFGSRNAKGEGQLYDYFMRSWVESTNNAYLGEQKAKEELDSKAREVFGNKVRRWSDLYDVVRRLPSLDVDVLDGEERKTFKLNQGNLLYIYMADKMNDGRMKLRKMGIDEETVQEIREFLDSRLVRLGDWLQDNYLVGKRTKYNKVHERMFGAPMAAIDHYFPIKILGDARTQEEDVNIPDSETLPSTITGNIIKRRRNSLPLDILHTDALSLAIEHVEDMERWAATAEWNKDVNTLLSYTTFRNKVKNMDTIYGSGDALWNTFKDTAKMAAGTYKPKAKPGSVDAAISNIAKGVTAAKINFRAYTAFKQLLSAPAFLHDVDLADFVKYSANPYGSWKWAMDNMPIFKKRWKSRQVGDTRLMDDPTDWKLWKTNIVQMATRLGMSPNALVDGITCAVGARAIYESRYKKYKQIGASDEIAHKRALQDAEIGYNLTQQSSEGAFVSSIQKDRTVAANMLSVFRNASMAYTRQWVDAARNLKHRTQPGYKEDSIKFMTRQIEEQFELSHEQAQKAAEAEYAKAGRHEVAKMLNMMFVTTVAWNLGASLPYLLMGDDNKTKKEMMTDVLIKGLVAGPTEGLAAGNIFSDLISRTVANEHTRKTFGDEGWGAAIDAAVKQGGDYEINPLPLMADLQSMIKKMGYDKFAAAQDVFNICMQSAVGVNPQTFTDMWNACMDYGAPGWDGTSYKTDTDNLANAKEIALFIMRLMNAPTSSWKNKYIDELGMNAEDAKKLSYAELASRYAHYKHWKDAPVTGWLRGEEGRQEKMNKLRGQFDKAVQERIERLTDEELMHNVARSGNLQERRMLAKTIAKRLGVASSVDGEKAKTEWQTIYQLNMTYEDIREDELLYQKKLEAKERGDGKTVKVIDKALKDINADKKKLETGNTEELMLHIRQKRREALGQGQR